ncbi:MAG: LptF/LptG family permease [Bacillota bacterium]
MSKTLFWYVFKDLLKIFVMTSLVLAGIMSFGGLLKPMMQYGLNGTQILKVLMYLLPAMQTYSLPIAALFATTVVYGRLAADNELIACRAGGISHMGMVMPAVVLALILSIVSLLCLCFVVPRYTLKVEKVAFDSLAEVVKKKFDRKHQISLNGNEIYAESVEILPPPPGRPDDEVIVLNGPVFCNYDEKTRKAQPVLTPTEFYTARRAIAVIHRDEDRVSFTAQLEGGASFPRQFQGAAIGGIATAQFGPIDLNESLIRENTKFMDIHQLKRLYDDPMRSRKVRNSFSKITEHEQEQEFLKGVVETLNRTGQYRFQGDEEAFLLQLDPEIKIPQRAVQIDEVNISSAPGSQTRQIRLQRVRDGEVIGTDEARHLSLRIKADPSDDQIILNFRLDYVRVGAAASKPTDKPSFAHTLTIPTPAELVKYKTRKVDYYLTQGSAGGEDLRFLRQEVPGLQSRIVAEIHSRVSFAVSCLILVVVGCALGMMFRTGNYLGAFALSVIPALLCIALMVTGQHVVENEGSLLKLGLATIWSGNAIVFVLAAALLGHLRRQ